MPSLSAYLPALPWILVPLAYLWRGRGTTSLDDFPPAPAEELPLISVIVPARNEARNIGRCLRSILSARNAALEVILVDDHSTDGTREIAESIAAEDDRLRVVSSPPLPPGWFGKQWACHNGFLASRGELLLFTDADTEHAPDLASRASVAMRAIGADLLSIMGHQELGTFWERLVQPQPFAMLALRYGSADTMNRARRVEDVIANGQCFLITREMYGTIGGHEAVRGEAAEDMMIAHAVFRAAGSVRMIRGTAQLSTRMYASLGEIVEGWSKNVYAAGRKSMPFSRLLGFLYPLLLVTTPLMGVIPVVVLILAAMGIGEANAYWAAAATVAMLLTWAAIYVSMEQPPAYALLYPVGSVVFAWICLRAAIRGRHVEWKGRAYEAA
jgi:chlorobactene glucosyltransferase